LCVCVSFFLLSKTPGNWAEFYIHQNELINQTLNKTFSSSWYVVLGSASAFLVSSIINALLNKTVGNIAEKKLQKDNFTTFALRSYISTFIAQFSDNMIFATVVSKVFFGWTWTQVLICSVFGATCELLCEVLFSGIGFKILQNWEKENVGNEYISYRKKCKSQKEQI
jgi:uncharacterized PurR-regulated membrane protein YhhQ (DUF165 family)